jgi:hypothetical protein
MMVGFTARKRALSALGHFPYNEFGHARPPEGTLANYARASLYPLMGTFGRVLRERKPKGGMRRTGSILYPNTLMTK